MFAAALCPCSPLSEALYFEKDQTMFVVVLFFFFIPLPGSGCSPGGREAVKLLTGAAGLHLERLKHTFCRKSGEPLPPLVNLTMLRCRAD